jgi:hypothetical protein
MKTKIYLAILLTVLSINQLFAQVSVLGSSGGSGDYVGWNSFQTFPLNIKHEANQPINFYTNTGLNLTPLAKLRMDISTDVLTSPSGTNSFEVSRVSIRESSLLWTLSGSKPGALLHLGHGIVPGTLGHRTWMDVGTYTAANTDNMYFGLKQEFVNSTTSQIWTDNMDAVISWGDNASTVTDNLNDLRFIFTTIPGTNGISGDYDGQEMARISYEGNFGIGNFYKIGTPTNTALRPARRLEVLDGAKNQPQLRLTHTQQNGVNTGAYTDFQSLSTGDLRINPKLNASNRFVGINTASALTTTLQLGANAANQSGLRFENLTFASPSITRATNTNKVLSLDNSGNVILVDDNEGSGGGGGGISFCSSGVSNNYLPIISGTNLLCKSDIYQFPTLN